MPEPLAEVLGSRWRQLRLPGAQEAVRDVWRDRMRTRGLDPLEAACTIREDLGGTSRGLRDYARRLMARDAVQRHLTSLEGTTE